MFTKDYVEIRKNVETSDLRQRLMQLVYPSLDPIQLDLKNGSSRLILCFAIITGHFHCHWL